AVADQPRKNSPLALGPLAKVAFSRVQKTLGVAPPLARRDRFSKHLDMLAGRHLQATTPEYAIDLLGSHNATMRVTRMAARNAQPASHAMRFRRGSRRTTSTVASSLPPRARASARSLPQRRASGAEPCSMRLKSRGSTCLWTP